MKNILFLIFTLSTLTSYSQNIEEYNQSCEWYLDAVEKEDLGDKVNIVKKNFREYEDFIVKDSEVDDPCRVLFILSVNKWYFLFSKNSYTPYRNPEMLIGAIKPEYIDAINFLNEKATKTLYGEKMQGVIIISSTSELFERKIDSILKIKK